MNDSGDDIVHYQQSVDMQKKINEVTGKQTAELITFEGASHGDAVIKTKENVANNLNFVDKILFNGNNPYRNTNYIDVKIAE